MRRTISALSGLAMLAGTVLALVPGSFALAPAATEFHYGIIVGEGPPPTAGRFFYEASLVSGSTAVEGVSAQLQARPYGAASFATVGSGITTSGGDVGVSIRLTRSTQLRWYFPGNAEFAASLSSAFYEAVAPKVPAQVQDATLNGSQKVIVTGHTAPSKPGTKISLWRGDKPAFAPDLHMTRIAVGVIKADGTFRITARFASSGTKRLYVKVNSGHGNAVGYSRYLHIHVHQ